MTELVEFDISYGHINVTVPLSSVEHTDLYSSLLSSTQVVNKLPFPENYTSVADMYIAYLNMQNLSEIKLKSSFELAHLVGDIKYLGHLVNIMLSQWSVYSGILDYLGPDLKDDVYLFLPYSLIPYELASKNSFTNNWAKHHSNMLITVNRSKVNIGGNGAKDQIVDEYSYNDEYNVYDKIVSLSEDKNGFQTLKRTWYDNGNLNSDEYWSQTTGHKVGIWSYWYENGNLKSQVYHERGTIKSSTDWYPDGITLEGECYFTITSDNNINDSSNVVKHGKCTSWYETGIVKSLMYYDNGELHGTKTVYYPSGKEYIQTSYINGVAHGKHTRRYSNGILSVSGQYAGGNKHGLWQEWDDSGNLKSEILYKNGYSDGIETTWYPTGKRHTETRRVNGVIDLVTTWYPDGITMDSECQYATYNGNDVKHGMCTLWYETGLVKTQRLYTNNVPDGIEMMWYPSGNKRSQTPYTNGTVNGIVKMWYDNKNNTLESEIGYNMGLTTLNGVYLKWQPNGDPTISGEYRDGLKHGPWQEWDKNGKLTNYIEYSYGETVMVYQQEGYTGNYF